VRLSPGSTPAEANRLVEEVESYISQMPHVKAVYATAGARNGNMDVLLDPTSERDMTAEEWVTQLQQKINERGFAGARVFVRRPRIRGLRTSTAGADIAVTIVGDELNVLQEIGAGVVRELQGIPGLANFDLQSETPNPRISVREHDERDT
jgi:multidrug efflux pump subunit AcrB